MGLVLGWVSYRTGSVLPGMLLHVLHNTVLLTVDRSFPPPFPPSVFAWDNAWNNKALISGKSALIFNAPVRLGGGQARRSESRRAAVDLPGRKARRAGIFPAATATGGSGTFPPTNRRRRACCSISRPARRSAN